MQKHLAMILVGLILGTAVALLWVSHEHRRLLRHWNDLEQQQQRMETHWEQLLLEQAALGAHGRIERIARDQLQMKYPALIDQERLDDQEANP
jgi:cell division protein FtsL